MIVFTGSYSEVEDDGINVYRLDMTSGALEHVSAIAGLQNPSFVALHPHEPVLYAVIETGDGAVTALAFDERTFELEILNSAATGGSPCHLTVDATGRFVLAANYGGGSVCMMPIRDDGRVEEASDFVQHEGSSVDPQRQTEPHAHSINIDPANRFAFAPDLGLDKIMIYELDLGAGKLRPNPAQPFATTLPGAGPRHFAFLPNRRHAYVINEMGNTITAFAYDDSQGRLEPGDSVPTLPADFDGDSATADIHVAPSGRFLYGSNRGHDSIAIYAIDGESGRLRALGHRLTGGQVPRNFGIDPTGTFLLAANMNTNDIRTFRIDPEDGSLTPTGHRVDSASPVCVRFLHSPTQ